MNILVTGGAGYIGSNVVRELVDAGHQVVIFDNLSTGHKELINKKAKFVEGDITNYDQILKCFKSTKFDAVMNFAAKLIVSESVSKPIEYFENNVGGVLNILKAMKETNVKNIVHSSTAAAYGIPQKMPVTEDMPLNPESPYGTSKVAAEFAIQDAAKAYGFNFCILRYFNVAGASDDSVNGLIGKKLTHIIPSIIEAAIGLRPKLEIYGNDYDTKDGTTVRDMIHVVDLAKAHLLGLDHIANKNKSGIFNLGTGDGYTILEMIQTTEKTLDKKVPYDFKPRRPGDVVRVVASPKKAFDELGWKIEKSLEDIISSDAKFRGFK